MAARYVMNAAILARAIVKPDPTGEMGHRLRPGPIRIILVPGNHATMECGLIKDLIVPETDSAFEELRGGH